MKQFVSIIALGMTLSISAHAIEADVSLCEVYLNRGHELVKDLAAGPTSPAVYIQWPKEVRHLNRHTRRQIYAQIRKEYPTLKKFSIDPRKEYLIAPKRAVDTLAALLDHPFEHFRKQISAGRNVRRVFTNYISRQQRRTLKAERGYSLYNGTDILRALEGVREELKAYEAAHPGANASMFMAGSFPNGRAHYNKSDIDAIVLPNDSSLYQKLRERISSELSRRADFYLWISVFAEMAPGHLPWNSQVSPINVYITAEKIELWIYPVLAKDPHRLFNDEHDIVPDVYQL